MTVKDCELLQKKEEAFKERDEILNSPKDISMEEEFEKLRKKEIDIRRYGLYSEDPTEVWQSLCWFIEQGEEDDLLQLAQIKTEIGIDPDRLPIYANNPKLVELLQIAKESIVARLVRQKNPTIYKLAEELFVDEGAIARWFSSTKQFLGGKTPLSCLKDSESVKLIETKIGQSLAGVCA